MDLSQCLIKLNFGLLCSGLANVPIACDDFVTSYYTAINDGKNLTSFYIKPDSTSPQADISLNGRIVTDPEQLQAIFQKDVGKCTYDCQSYDCQVLNTNYNVGAPEHMLAPNKDGKKLSILLMVSGGVKYRDSAEGEVRGFSESIILVPNWNAQGPKASKGLKKWLIQSQTFRLVV